MSRTNGRQSPLLPYLHLLCHLERLVEDRVDDARDGEHAADDGARGREEMVPVPRLLADHNLRMEGAKG